MSAYSSGPSGLSIATLVLGILSVLGLACFTGIPAWILGAMELRNISSGTSSAGGRTLALAGMILGIVATVLAALAILALLLVSLDAWTFSV